MNLRDLSKLQALLPTLKGILRAVLADDRAHQAGKIDDALFAARIHDQVYKLKMLAGQQRINIDEMLK